MPSGEGAEDYTAQACSANPEQNELRCGPTPQHAFHSRCKDGAHLLEGRPGSSRHLEL